MYQHPFPSKKTHLHFIAAMLLVFFALSCKNIFYYPDKRTFSSPEKFGFVSNDIFYKSYDGTLLHLWHIHSQKKPSRGVILQLHGNAENMSTHFFNLLWLAQEGYDLYTYDYRGYGKSEGKPNREKIQKDSALIIDHISRISREKNQKLIVYAQSLGSIIALKSIPDLKEKDNVAAFVVEGGFSSYRAVAKSKIRLLCFPPFDSILSLFFSDKMSPDKTAFSEISPALLVVMHGRYDTVMPYKFGREIYVRAENPKIFIDLAKGGHLNWNRPDMIKHKDTFLSILSDAAAGRINAPFQDVLTFD